MRAKAVLCVPAIGRFDTDCPISTCTYYGQKQSYDDTKEEVAHRYKESTSKLPGQDYRRMASHSHLLTDGGTLNERYRTRERHEQTQLPSMHNARKDNPSNHDRYGQITQIGAGWLGSIMLAPMVGILRSRRCSPTGLDTERLLDPW